MLEKCEQGNYPSTAPVGYRNIQEDWKRKIAIDERFSPVVKRIFGWYFSDTLSIADIEHITLAVQKPLYSQRTKFCPSFSRPEFSVNASARQKVSEESSDHVPAG